jgi:hypothetical protein
LDFETNICGVKSTVRNLIVQLHEKASQKKSWWLVRHTAGMLEMRHSDLAKVSNFCLKYKYISDRFISPGFQVLHHDNRAAKANIDRHTVTVAQEQRNKYNQVRRFDAFWLFHQSMIRLGVTRCLTGTVLSKIPSSKGL